MNSLLLLSSRIAPFAAAAGLLAVLGAAPARASVVANSTSFNGVFSAVASLSGSVVTGDGTSSNSPVGLVSEHFVYGATSIPDGLGNAGFSGYSIFSTLDGSSTLYANVNGTINVNSYSGTGTDTFNGALSTGIFAGASGTAQFNATVPLTPTISVTNNSSVLSTTAAPNITQQFHDGTLIGNFAAVPETSSVVSLGLLLALGVGGVLVARKKASRAA